MFLLGLAAAVLPAHVPPVDQCAAEPGFAEFRAGLKQAIAARDSDALLAAVADDIYVSFGGGRGKQDFRSFWKLDEPEKSELWKELGAALELGCAVSGERRIAPSFIEQVEGRDPFETLIALPGAVLRRTQSDSSRVVAKLDWDALTVLQYSDDGPWVDVQLDDGRHGFIRTDQARGVLDYRATFRKAGGRWVMTAFVAGD